ILGNSLMTGQRALAPTITKYEEIWHATFLYQRLTIWRQAELSRSVAGMEHDCVSDTLHVIVTSWAVPFDYTKQRAALRDHDFGGRVVRILLGMLSPVELLAHYAFGSNPSSIKSVIGRQRS